jgi:alpha-L-arabinofuranosidase B-like protein
MSEDDPLQNNHRVGRWVPRYSGPAHRGRFGRLHRDPLDFESAGTLAVLGLLAILALVGVIIADLPRQDDRKAAPHNAALPAPPHFSMPAVFPPPSAPSLSPPPSSAAPLPPGSAAGPARTSTPAGPGPTWNWPGVTGPPTSAPPAPAPAPARLIVGTTVSLEAAGSPGSRVRHRNFRARLDRVGPASGAGDRADATFRVRSGLAGGGGCVSLEAANFPHRFLRHRDFAVVLHAIDGSALFASDATFCPESVAGGRLVLRSVNYPQRYVTVRDSLLFLDRVPAGAALSLSVRPPLT